ncbi:MAG: ATP-binding cassette domain-containing protein [Chloroflexi bacterium]|nr:ATP-binding cassette domain-containing protein [Chloroflexota bacterium]
MATQVRAQRVGSPIRIEARGLRVVIGKDGKGPVLLNDASLTVLPGELVAIVGGSGAGKTTLLNALAGVKPPTAGHVTYNGTDLYAHIDYCRSRLGYVPQDDIVHKDLTVERTLHYAGKLRLPEASPSERETLVREALTALGLERQAKQRVGSLSGGQRKRASIGVELLTKPGVFFLDEPTSGLDPATGREMMRLLRRLADAGSTIVVTTHAPQDIGGCDRVVFLAPGGLIAYAGAPQEALAYFNVSGFEQIYERVAAVERPQVWAERLRSTNGRAPSQSDSPPAAVQEAMSFKAAAGSGSFIHQWLVLSQRNLETLTRNRLTLAILVGSPVMVIMMFAILFRSGAFKYADPSPTSAVMILFWLAFDGFFFGLTYGLLQICTEFPIFFRERLVNLKIAPYVLSKATVLLPMLGMVVAVMLLVLWGFQRLPDGNVALYTKMALTLLLVGVSALALGLLASAAVTSPEQASLALPMLCFPAVLFSGAILSIPSMAVVGKAIAFFMPTRYGFEALGHTAKMDDLFANGASPLGKQLLVEYNDTFAHGLLGQWVILAAFAVVFFAGACLVLRRKSVSR